MTNAIENTTLTDGTEITIYSTVYTKKGKWGAVEPAKVLRMHSERGPNGMRVMLTVRFDSDTDHNGGWDPIPASWCTGKP